MYNRALKVKIKSLAAEARIIRAEERKTLGFARRFTRLDNREGHEAFIEQHHEEYESLHKHRVHAVRDEARVALLAYGYMRGRLRTQIEKYIPPAYIFARAHACLKRFGVAVTEDQFRTWAIDETYKA